MQKLKKGNDNIIDYAFAIAAITLLISLFLKAIFDMDTNYDVGWYHLPFAARIWGIISEASFTAGTKVEDRFDGFPLLAHFFQGFLWKITGRIEATRLVGYFSVVIYLFFLRSFFKVPLFVSTIAIFTIPAVLTHAPGGFVDLPGNIGVAVALMLLYVFFRESRMPTKKELLTLVLGAAVAANTKPQLQPLVFVIFWVTIARLTWLYFKYQFSDQFSWKRAIFMATLTSALIFATPIKNTVLYGNPFYPIRVEMFGKVLNHKAMPQTYSEGERPQKWLRSILEINTPQWSVDQFNRTNNPKYLDRAGGFFGAYMLFNLALISILAIYQQLGNKKTLNAPIALAMMLFLSLFCSNFPQSHELRYFMFWAIVLVSLNLSLVFNMNWARRKTTYLKSIYLVFFIMMCVKIESFYLKPDWRYLNRYLNTVVDKEVLEQISPTEENCLISFHGDELKSSVPIQYAFYYNAYFHPEIGKEYKIVIADDRKKCQNLNTVPRNVQ